MTVITFSCNTNLSPPRMMVFFGVVLITLGIHYISANTSESCLLRQLNSDRTHHFFEFYDPDHGLCNTDQTVPDLKECSGNCVSKAQYIPEQHAFITHCKCCTAYKSVSRTITIKCDKQTFQKTYMNPTECLCIECKDKSNGSTIIVEPTPA